VSEAFEQRVPPRTLAGATILQTVPALREEPVARTAVDIARVLLQFGARALIAAEGGPLVNELNASGAEWIPLAADSLNPFRLRANARAIEQLIAASGSTSCMRMARARRGARGAAAARSAVWFVTTLPDLPSTSGWHALYAGALARGDRIIAPSAFAAARSCSAIA